VGKSTVKKDDDLRVRPGRVRSGGHKTVSFLNQALKAAAKAGGMRRSNGSSRGSFGRGRAASLAAAHALGSRSRGPMVKARVVRRMRTPGALAAHLRYLGRDGVTRDGAPGRLFDREGEDADRQAFAERCDDDRHHFRFIVSPDDAHELADLKDFTRELMTDAERDLGTKLDWVAVEHHNTEHPHIHVLVRGITDRGDNLVISRDYISEGLRARAGALVTLELGPRTELEVKRLLDAQIDADRWTRLDRAIMREVGPTGVVDLRPDRLAERDPLRDVKLGRMRKLERLGLAEPNSASRWTLDGDLEAKLRALGERDDIIKRLHRAMGREGGERAASALVLEGEGQDAPVIGKLVDRGLNDELKGTAYAIVDGMDGRAHHLRLPDLDAASDGPVGSVVELRRFQDKNGRDRVALAVRSDLSLERQAGAPGATWLDRRLIARETTDLAEGGFGAEVREAMRARADHLVGQGLAHRDGGRLTFARDLIATLRGREVDAVATRIRTETGLAYQPSASGEHVTGTYRQRLSLASGRFAMLDNGLGFQLVPWTPALERHLGQHVSGVAVPGGSVEWSMDRQRGLGM